MLLANFFVYLSTILKLLLNHLINIPLNLLAGLGKFYVVMIAFIIDIIQSTIYTKILEGNKIFDKLKFFKNLLPEESKIQQKPFFTKFRKPQYLGIFILASLPVYTGGICAAATLRYISKNLNPKKSLIVMYLGSLLGCIIWVLGINFLFEVFKFIFKV